MSSKPTIPRPLARRIDRLAVAAHAFHRFAHHPLCDRYQGELIPLGHRVRICRGCTLAIAGLVAGAGAGWLTRSLELGPTVWLALSGSMALAILPLGRSKLLRRFLPGLLLTLAVFHGPLLISALAAVATGAMLALYRRRTPNRVPCATCPQRTLEVCDGFAPVVRRERAFRRLTGRWLEI